MTEIDPDLVRRTTDHFNRREIAWAMEGAAEDFELDWSNSIGPLKGVYRGKQAVEELWTSFFDAWDAVHWEPQEILELGEDRIMVVNRVRMRGKGSGVEVEATGVQVWTIRDGELRRIKLYQTKQDAFADLGIQPESWA